MTAKDHQVKELKQALARSVERLTQLAAEFPRSNVPAILERLG
jgi:hypothetical protein